MSLRAVADRVAIHSTLVLRLALNATARACAKERGLPRRALDSTQGKPCSVALLGLAFTMAEILLSLTIIGVVAAIMLPSLTGNINERTWQTQGKALFSRMSQAIALMPSLNGYGTLTAETTSTSAIDTAAETFVTNGLAKVLKINNICDNEHLQDCGIPDSYVAQGGSKRDFPTTLSELNSKIVGSNGLAIDVKAAAACRKLGNEYRLPTRDEMASLFYNMNFVLGDSTGFSYQYQIDKQVGNNTFWRFQEDGKIWQYVGGNVGALCVKTR